MQILFPKYFFILFILFHISINIQAQFVNYGSDPVHFKWNTVRTQHYQLTYPQGIDSTARRYAILLETAYPHIGKTIGTPPKKTFPVILHPANMLSNGMVAWAPKRMELITTPRSDMYAQSWSKQLVIHESRHVFQTDKLTRKIFMPLYYALGEQVAGVAGLAIPKWFFEGDAVTTETALSSSGRGRLPEFNMIYRAQTISDKSYTFDKWFLGSYKDYTGNFYTLGYDLTAYARYQYGADIWDKVTDRYTRHIYLVPPFSRSLRHYTGIGTKGLFNQTFSFLKHEWEIQDSLYLTKEAKHKPVYLSPETKQYTSYQYPQIVNDSIIIAVKSNLQDIHSLVIIRNGNEKRLSYIGHINSRIILRNNRIYWTEYVQGIRWTHENYSVIKYYDLNAKRTITLTPHRRYLSPFVEVSGKVIAVSYISESGVNQIVWIDTDSGKEMDHYHIPDNIFIKDMTFGEDNSIIAVMLGDNGIQIQQLNNRTKLWKELLKPTHVNITSPVWYNGKLFFESGLNGTNNIYCLDMETLQCRQLTAARFGAFSPTLSADGRKLFYADYQAKGHRIVSVNLDSLTTNIVDFTRPYHFTLADSISRQESFNLDTAELSPIDFHPKPYHRMSHLFKIHSWTPFFYDATRLLNRQTDNLFTAIKPGAMILSQNTLNTAITQLGWYYTKGEHHGKLAFTYMGWYPVIELNVDYGGKAFDVLWTKDQDNREKEFFFTHDTDRNLIKTEVQAYIPFNFTHNHYISGLQPSITYYYTNNRYQQAGSNKFRDFQYFLTELIYYRYRERSQQDIFPRWGGQIRLQHLRTLLNTENYGSLYAVQLTGYLPGLVQNNGIMLRLGYQHQNMDGKALYLPQRLLNAPRGHNYNYASYQQLAVKADYSFTILYPDFSLGWLAYIKRIRSNIFYDCSFNHAYKKTDWTTQSSYGVDLILDWNAIQAEFPLSTGVRIIKPTRYSGVRSEWLFNISF
ncbi:hypothetical protein EZS27_011360 [termite gut metagenome]|uniref:Protein TolB n=1 Tax=termite gut metagenome TaxID=433724 RepID=A0A5J4S5Y7_9ZZZZ